MIRQLHFSFLMATVCLVATPMDATAGGLGLFKRCKPKQVACCPQPAPCQTPCVVECTPCEDPKSVKWKAIGTCIHPSGLSEELTSGDCYENAYEAIYDVYNQAVGCTLYTVRTVLCDSGLNKHKDASNNDPQRTDNTKSLHPLPPPPDVRDGLWKGNAMFLKPSGNLVSITWRSRSLKSLVDRLERQTNGTNRLVMLAIVRESKD